MKASQLSPLLQRLRDWKTKWLRRTENWLFFGVPLGTICGGNGKLVASKNLNENLDEGGFFTMMVVVNQYWIGSDF